MLARTPCLLPALAPLTYTSCDVASYVRGAWQYVLLDPLTSLLLLLLYNNDFKKHFTHCLLRHYRALVLPPSIPGNIPATVTV